MIKSVREWEGETGYETKRVLSSKLILGETGVESFGNSSNLEDCSLGGVIAPASHGHRAVTDSFLKIWLPELSLLYHEYLLAASYLTFCFVLPWEQKLTFLKVIMMSKSRTLQYRSENVMNTSNFAFYKKTRTFIRA